MLTDKVTCWEFLKLTLTLIFLMNNIKFLKGYGISIKQSENKIHLANGCDPFTGIRETESYYLPNFPYEKIVISGDGYISTKAVQLLLENNIHIIQVDTHGKLITSMCTPTQSQVMTKWRMGQYQTFSNQEKAQELRRYYLGLKVQSEIRLLDYLLSDSKKSTRPSFNLDQTVKILKSHHSKIKHTKTKNEIDRLEQETSKLYFKEFSGMIPERFDYSIRYNDNWLNPTKNATNVINALLNYGYAVLASDITKYVHAFGLDPYYGFNHKMGYYMALVYDIIEPFRTVVDSTVLQMANSKAKDYGRIPKKQYYNTNKGFVILDTRLITKFLEMLQNILNKKRPYKISRGRRSVRLANKMSHAQESTIIREEVRRLANYCIGKQNIFSI